MFYGRGKRNSSVKREKGKITCKNCLETRHDEDHCWELYKELKPDRLKAKEKGKIVDIAEKDLGSNSRDETKITAMGLKGQHVESTSSSNRHNNTPNEDKMEELFTIRVISNHTKIDVLFNSGSQANLISKDLVK